MDTRYNIKITDLSVRDKLIKFQKRNGLNSQQSAISELLSIAERQNTD